MSQKEVDTFTQKGYVDYESFGANAENQKTNYYSRGISVKRSNVVIDGMLHTVTREGQFGAPYMGFIAISECAFVTVQNTSFTGRKTYRKIGSAGVGVANATIRNSTLGHMGINAIGEGLLQIENTKVSSNRLINFRDDYGSTLNGEVIIRNSEFTPTGNKLSSVNVIIGTNDGQHNFGYVCYMPERITIENLKINDANTSSNYKGPAIPGNFNPKKSDAGYVEKFPYIVTKKLILKNITTQSGKPFRISDNEFMFKDMKTTNL